MRTDDPPPSRGRAARRAPIDLHVEVVSGPARLALSRATIEGLATRVLRAEGVRRAHLAITLVGRARIARLHRDLTGVPGATDIVTLEHARAEGAPVVGEVFIAPEVAAANARALGIPVREELARLVVHGVLHSLGWSHPEGADRTASPMWRRQEDLLRAARRAGIVP